MDKRIHSPPKSLSFTNPYPKGQYTHNTLLMRAFLFDSPLLKRAHTHTQLERRGTRKSRGKNRSEKRAQKHSPDLLLHSSSSVSKQGCQWFDSVGYFINEKWPKIPLSYAKWFIKTSRLSIRLEIYRTLILLSKLPCD